MTKKALLALLLLAALLCAGCGGNPAGGDVSSAPEQTEPAPEEILLDLVRDGKCRYKIIFPQGEDEYVKLADRLASSFKNVTGNRPEAGFDFLAPGSTPGDREILIGPVDRDESRLVLSGLRHGEYAIRAVGTRLVICGSNASATTSAVNKFISTFLKGQLTELQYSSADDFTKTNTYRIASCTVGGVPLGSFTVTYEDGCGSAEYAARDFADHISRCAGLTLPVAADSSAPAHAVRFVISSALGRGKIRAEVTGDGIVVSCADYAGMLEAVAELEARHFSVSGSQDVVLTPGVLFEKDTSADAQGASAREAGALRVMYHNVWGYQEEYPVLCRARLALDVYRLYAPDVLCFEEAGPLYRSGAREITDWFRSAGYQEICDSVNGGTGNPIYFNTAALKLVESGYGKARSGDKGTTWAVLERKTDGKRFAVTNFHFAANSNAGGDTALGDKYRAEDAQKAAEIITAIAAKYPGIPIVSGGDCNAVRDSEAFRNLTATGAVNVRDLTDGGWNDPSAYHGSFSPNLETGLYPVQTALTRSGPTAIDHIFLYGTSASLLHRATVTDFSALTSSDHAPHFADFKLN